MRCKKGLIPKDYISPFIPQLNNTNNINYGVINNNFDNRSFGTLSQNYSSTNSQSNKMSSINNYNNYNHYNNQIHLMQRPSYFTNNLISRANYVPFSKMMAINKTYNSRMMKNKSNENKKKNDIQEFLYSVNWKINDEFNSDNIISKKLGNSNKYMNDIKNFSIRKDKFSRSLFKFVH